MKYKVVIAVGHEQIVDQIKKFDEIEVVEENDDIEIVEEVLEFVDVEYAVINTMLSAEKSLKFARRAKKLGIKVICIIDEEKDDRELIVSLAGCGVNAMIALDELYKIPDFLDTYPDGFDFHGLADDDEQVKKQKRVLLKKKTTVAVLGVMSRIGTSTQALRLAKLLNDRGYKAAYIELNNSGHIHRLAETYDGAEMDEQLGKITYADLDMYYKPDQIPEILKKPYLFYIYDFGDIRDQREQVTWLEKDIKVLVSGTKPDEIVHMEYALERVYQQNTKYIFSFSDASEHQDVKAMMRSKSNVTYFAPWMPDPFGVSVGEDYLLDMMADALAKTEPEQVTRPKAQKMFIGRKQK